MTPPDLSIIVVSWNVREFLRACLGSVVSHPSSVTAEVVVVDSASSDGSAEMVARDFPGAQLIASGENLGYSRGNNRGMAAARGRYLFLLNPDAEIVGEALARMVRFMDEQPEVGVLGPQLLDPDGSVQSSRRRFPNLLTAFFESTWLQPLAPRRLLDRYYVLDRPDDATTEVDWVTGAALLIRRETYQQVGGLDESLFMYSEETDYCKRVKSAGWRVVYFPDAQVVHHAGKSSDQAIPERHIRFQRSKIRYYRKHHGALVAAALRLFLLASYLEQLLLEAAKGLCGHKRDLRRQRVEAYWRVLLSGLKG